ncbi:hypothetical protein KR009_008219 [Drosophila setifemur]|nr:hypothetical protein KR009_008219 [Drosophila setifemur]
MAQVTDADTRVDTPGVQLSEETAEKLEPSVEPKNAGANLEDELAELNGGNDANEDENETAADGGQVLDELSSLEQEIAKMHNIRPPTSGASEAGETSSVGGAPENGGSGDVDKQSHPTISSPLRDEGKETSGNGPSNDSPLEEVDLIALLKGTDTSHDQDKDNESSALEKKLSKLDNVEVGVTIEGEGQYEIMEIDDDEGIAGEMSPKPTASKKKPSPASAPLSATASSSSAKPKLSPEQARAVALEQMAGLKSQKARRKEQAPASKTSAAPKPKDIVSTLNDDWDDYDSEEDNPLNTPAPAPAFVTTKPPLPAKKGQSGGASKPTTNPAHKSLIGSVKVMLKTVTQKQMAGTAKPVVVTAPVAQETAEPTTGFKRMRVIKRKIIWDPDVPESQKSFAHYASSKAPLAPAPTQTAPPKVPKLRVKSNSPTISVKKEPPVKKPRAATPKDLVKAASKVGTLAGGAAEADARAGSPAKRRSQTPNAGLVNGGPQKKKKVSEIDRLMGDEGAANMIQAVEHEQREMSGGEVTNKPLMRKRAMTITGRNQNRASLEPSQPMSPKKEPPHAPKSTSKRASAAADSVFTKATVGAAGTKGRASDSWDYVYKQRASEESMIMRRRSNSSYSSNASVSRLSLDNKPGGAVLSDDAAEGSDPSFKFLKPVNKANQRGAESSTASSSQTLANDLKGNSGHLVTLKKVDKVAHLVINPHRGKTGYTYGSQLLHKLSETLGSVARNNGYNTVLLTVQGQQFCQGIDCQELVQGSLEKRRNSACVLGQALKTYLRTLATFPKPMVAGIVGNLKNLGIMQLPLVDYVVASEDCCFETNYAKLGQLPEGYALWHGHEKVSSQVHSRLFLLGERLIASDILGPKSFIDMTCKPRNVTEEALAVAKQISTTSAETYRTLKKLNHSGISAAKWPRLEEELKVIVEQWSSTSCLANMKRYLSDVHF